MVLRHVLIAAGAAALASSSAVAQNALGDGTALDQRVEITAPRDRAASQRLSQEIGFRNAIVTGNAPGGLSFRGDVGYRAPSEFRGDLGSNELFAFRRDSFYSGLSGQGIRGIDALQYQFALTTGATTPSGLIGVPVIRESGAGASGADIAAPRASGTRIPDTELTVPNVMDVEEDGALLGTLRATSAYSAVRSFQPTMLGYRRDSQGRTYGMTASPLDGIRARLLDMPETPGQFVPEPAPGTTTPGMSLDQEEDTPGTPAGDRTRSETGITSRADSRVDVGRTMYDVVRDRLADQARREGLDPELLDRDLTALRRALADLRARESTDAQRDEQDDSSVIPRPVDPSERTEPILPGMGRDEDEGEGEGDEERREGDPIGRIIDRLGAPGAPIANLVDPGARPGDVYTTHMQKGESLLAEGRFFDAEERFTRALAARSGDVSAQVGRIHAQLGAGLYLSAAVNLRSLLTTNPEVAGVRYEAPLLPGGDRARAIFEQLTDNVEATDLTGPDRLGSESALLLAYFGYQRGERDAIGRGLDMLGRSDTPSDRSLLRLLDSVWLEPIEDSSPEPEPSGSGDAGADGNG